MEHAIIINRLEDLKNIKPKYTRIYFGNEFCPRLLPSIQELSQALKIIKEMGREFTLITPWADSEGLEKIKRLVDYLAKRQFLKEVVVNDVGVLHYIKREFPLTSIIIGRMLSRLTLFSINFLEKMAIKRIEIDFSLSNLPEIRENDFIKLSFYYPYTAIQGTRYCSMANIAKNKRENPGITNCLRECLKIGALRIKHSSFIPEIILKGNAQFIKNKINIKALDMKNIDRLVFQPQPPV